jgi:aminoglycoside phosphotransferase (APT) family kinase protein
MKLEQVIAQRADKTIYRDGDLCVKVFREGYSKADILNEALNQARVEEIGLSIPKIQAVTMVDGKWAILTNFVEGKTLAEKMKEEPEKKGAYLEQFLDLQISIHSKTCRKLNRQKDKLRDKIDESGLDATTRYELHTRLEGMPRHKKVCHGDFNPSNIIMGTDGTAYLLDWSHATQGNASADVARTYLYFSMEGEEDTAEQYLNLFCKKTDTARQYVQRWMPIVAASQLARSKESEREFLLRWINVMDYQ